MAQHNLSCSKSRAAKAILDDQGVPASSAATSTDQPTADELDQILTALGREPREIARLGEPDAAITAALLRDTSR